MEEGWIVRDILTMLKLIYFRTNVHAFLDKGYRYMDDKRGREQGQRRKGLRNVNDCERKRNRGREGRTGRKKKNQ